MDKYKDVSVVNLVETLKGFVRKKSGPGLSPELRELVGILKSQKLRHRNDAHAFCVDGNGMRILQDLLQDCERGKDSRDLALVLGTIGNLCALGSEPRKMVRWLVKNYFILHFYASAAIHRCQLTLYWRDSPYF